MPEGKDTYRDGIPRLNWDRNRPPNEQIVDLEGRSLSPAQPYEDDLEEVPAAEEDPQTYADEGTQGQPVPRPGNAPPQSELGGHDGMIGPNRPNPIDQLKLRQRKADKASRKPRTSNEAINQQHEALRRFESGEPELNPPDKYTDSWAGQRSNEPEEKAYHEEGTHGQGIEQVVEGIGNIVGGGIDIATNSITNTGSS